MLDTEFGHRLFKILKSNFLIRGALYTFYVIRFVYHAAKERSLFSLRYYPGYHGSTIPSLKELKAREKELFSDKDDALGGIEMNESEQITLLEKIIGYYGQYRPPKNKNDKSLYYYDNRMFGFNDGFVLYGMLRLFKPKRIIEIGSGFSSALMLDTCYETGQTTSLTFIDPWSTTIFNILKRVDRDDVNYVKELVQDINLDTFRELEENDILFIDSSHSLKTGSDLSFIVFKILPILKPGVLVHIHDIWYPFEYPKDMVFEGRTYNEAYVIRSFLQFNMSFEILYFSSFLEQRHTQAFAQLPSYNTSEGKSLWLRRTAVRQADTPPAPITA